jgi:hypothetical protein
MITLTHEEAQQVLDALESVWLMDRTKKQRQTIETLRARLAQPEHWSDCAVHSEPAYPAGECDCGLVPVAWADKHDIEREGHDFYVNRQQPAKDGVPLYTAPPQREWQGLTDEEIMSLLPGAVRLPPGWVETVRAIEEALRRKNT